MKPPTILNVVQGSDEWKQARAGLVTASRLDEIITPKTRKLSGASTRYMHELIAEWLLGTAIDDGYEGGYMKRGSAEEESAVRFYELQRDVQTTRVGLVVRSDGKVACSPDRLVGADGGLEIKCPGAPQQVANLLSMTEQHTAQVQGCMWLTGRRWWDLLSFNPHLPPALVRVPRDEAFIEALAGAVEEFLVNMDEAKARLAELGHIPASVGHDDDAAQPF